VIDRDGGWFIRKPAAAMHAARMRISLAFLLLFAVPVSAGAQVEEDEAHRADRERTEALNRAANQVVERRSDGNADAMRRYRAARERYERELAAWRKRVAECEGGRWESCD
jgi:hypothetical protein